MQYDAQALWQMDKDHFIHPYTDFPRFNAEGSQLITEASGNYITDANGNRFLDGIAGLWCVNIGHGRQEMADAIADQVTRMAYYNPFGQSTNAPAAELAAKLAALAPGDLNHVFYTCGGSMSNDMAIRLAHYYFAQLGLPEKKFILSRNDAYHGSTCIAANLTGIQGTKIGFEQYGKDFIEHLSAANLYRRPKGAETLSDADYCQFLVDELENRILQLGADQVAAFIAEPIMGAGGVLVAPAGYHRAMAEVCKKYQVLYIADEVVTAFGRLGEWFASESVFGHVPDIIVCAKGISSGYIPLGATLVSDRMYEVISQPQCPGGALTMGFTYSGHAVACRAALKNIEILERENILQNVKTLGPYLHDRALSLLQHPCVGDVRGQGFMLGIELVADKTGKKSFDPSVAASGQIFELCAKAGVIVRPVGNQIIVSPPLTLNQAELDKIIDTLDAALTRFSQQHTPAHS